MAGLGRSLVVAAETDSASGSGHQRAGSLCAVRSLFVVVGLNPVAVSHAAASVK